MNNFRGLSYEDLYSWVGKKTFTRGQSYQKGKKILTVFQISDNIICGTVQGSEIYDTVVSGSDHLTSLCSCPVGSDCKHGVALLLTYLEQIKRGKQVPPVPSDEYIRRYQPLLSPESKHDDNSISAVKHPSSNTREYLQTLSKEELIAIILSGIEGTYDIRTYIDRRQKLDQDSPDSSIKSIIAEIEEVTSQEFEYSDWYESDDIPDYSGILSIFTALLESKRYTDIFTLGLILLQKAQQHVEMDDESGSISNQISECMTVVAEALDVSDLPIHQNLLSAIELIENDEYSLTEDILDYFNQSHPALEWSIVADTLLDRRSTIEMKGVKLSDTNLHALQDNIEIALERANRLDEAIAFSKHLAEEEQRHLPYIKLLTRTNHKEDAIKWIQKVVRERPHDPHTTRLLLRKIRKIFEESADWLMVSALDTESFLRNPDIGGYKNMMQSANQAGIADSIRPHIYTYLKEGTFPSSAKQGSVIPGLLPETGVSYGIRYAAVNPPVRPLLLEMALESGDPDEVLTWYIPKTNPTIHGSRPIVDDRIADVIVEKYPDKAIEIWKTHAETLIETKNPDFYQYAVMFLIKVRNTSIKADKSDEFSEYILRLKTEHSRKRRFIQELAILEGRKIIDDM